MVHSSPHTICRPMLVVALAFLGIHIHHLEARSLPAHPVHTLMAAVARDGVQAAVVRASRVRGVAVPDTVRLAEPPDGDTVRPEQVTLRWQQAAGALRYDVSLSLSQAFSQRVDSNGVTATQLVVRNLPVDRTIYWRVRAVDASGAGPWCTPHTFSTRTSRIDVPDSVKPLTELGSGLYNGFPGGLYPNGGNVPPQPHLAAGLALSREILPRDTNGAPDPNGTIVLLSLGMSNATQEFSRFKTMADTFARRNPRLVIVDGAQGGQTASVISNPTANFWSVVEQRLRTAGVTARQVQAIWLKEANAGPTTGFPRYAQDLQNDLRTIVRSLPGRYPNLKITYLSSRIYGGYATTSLNPEMYAYESGFSVKWLIEQQIAGDTALAFAGPQPRAPWLAWGPYLWCNGLHPRADGLVWGQGDVVQDGTHPSMSGQIKVANLLLNFLAGDTTSHGWFLRPAPSTAAQAVERRQISVVLAPDPARNHAMLTITAPSSAPVGIELFDAVGRRLPPIAQPSIATAGSPINVPLDVDVLAALPTGVYYVRVTCGGEILARPLRIVR